MFRHYAKNWRRPWKRSACNKQTAKMKNKTLNKKMIVFWILIRSEPDNSYTVDNRQQQQQQQFLNKTLSVSSQHKQHTYGLNIEFVWCWLHQVYYYYLLYRKPNGFTEYISFVGIYLLHGKCGWLIVNIVLCSIWNQYILNESTAFSYLFRVQMLFFNIIRIMIAFIAFHH